MKKYLLISSEFPPLPGGIGNHAYHLAKYLHEANKEISVLTNIRDIKEDAAFDEIQKFKIYRIKRNLFTKLNRIKKAFTIAKRNETIICSGKFSLWTGGVLKLFFSNRKYIAILHGSEIRAGGKLSQVLTQWSLQKFNEIIAVSNFTRKSALANNQSLKVEVINNGFVRPEVVTTNNKLNSFGYPMIVTVGNVTFRKGQQNVINALPLLKKNFPGIHYHCIGIPTEKDIFSELAKSLNVQNNVTFHGALQLNDLVSILNSCNVFFMLSDNLDSGDFEGFGIAILEANALGLPAIGSNNSGITDAISSGFSGELVDSKDVEQILNAFSKIMNNYEEYSANAICWSKNFSWQVIGKKYLEIIER